MASILIKGREKYKWGTLSKVCVSHFGGGGGDKYPKTILSATGVMSDNNLDTKFYEKKKPCQYKAHNDTDD